VLLGGLLIHGIFPGPEIFKLHPKVVWTFIDSLLVGQFLMLVFGLYMSGVAKYVLRTPAHYMAGVIIVLSIFGTYSVQNSFADVIIMLSLGVFMFFISKLGFSAAPIVLGIMLGPIAEANFITAKLIADTQDGILMYLINGPINQVMIAICFFSIFYGLYGEVKKKKRSK